MNNVENLHNRIKRIENSQIGPEHDEVTEIYLVSPKHVTDSPQVSVLLWRKDDQKCH